MTDDQTIILNIFFFGIMLFLMYIFFFRQEDKSKVTLEQLLNNNADLIQTFLEKIKEVPIKFFRVTEAIKTFENAPTISYSRLESEHWHIMYPELYAYGDLVRDYLIEIALRENRKDVSPLNGELIPQWQSRIEKNPPADWSAWGDLHMHLFFLAIEINENLHNERDNLVKEERQIKEKKERERTLEVNKRLDLFYVKNNIIIKRFFEIANKKAVIIDDYGDKLLKEIAFNDELQIFLVKISSQLEMESIDGYPEIKDEISVFLRKKFEDSIK